MTMTNFYVSALFVIRFVIFVFMLLFSVWSASSSGVGLELLVEGDGAEVPEFGGFVGELLVEG